MLLLCFRASFSLFLQTIFYWSDQNAKSNWNLTLSVFLALDTEHRVQNVTRIRLEYIGFFFRLQQWIWSFNKHSISPYLRRLNILGNDFAYLENWNRNWIDFIGFSFDIFFSSLCKFTIQIKFNIFTCAETENSMKKAETHETKTDPEIKIDIFIRAEPYAAIKSPFVSIMSCWDKGNEQ